MTIQPRTIQVHRGDISGISRSESRQLIICVVKFKSKSIEQSLDVPVCS